ncbi:MAG TPA: hypothetical protein VGJ29_03295 [Vicinamibacterales bacterium]|jgi:hypothetical protein
MSQEVQTGLKQRTQQLMDGPLKHIRGAALAAALLPLASIAAAPASAQTPATSCASGGTCGIVFNDTNGNGILDIGETPIEGATVYVCPTTTCNPTADGIPATTDLNGEFGFPPGSGLPSTPIFFVTIPTGTQASPLGPDNIGENKGSGYSVGAGVLGSAANNFGFTTTAIAQPGTGTPGYWKNHPEAWPNIPLVVGGVTYTKVQAVAWLGKTGKDKTVTMFQSLLSAMLSAGVVGNDGSCISASITQGNNWLMTYPLGSNVAGGSAAWTVGDPIHITLDAYDNGLLCAPHRQ